MKRCNIFQFFSIVLIISLSGCNYSDDTSTYSPQQEWYEGGNLHSSTITEWNAATYRNKLATCGDFIAQTDKTSTLDEIKLKANNLLVCIDESTIEMEDPNSMTVSEVATLCMILMGYD